MRRRIVTALGAVAVLVAGCGGGARQDADERSGTYDVAVTQASFPAKQRLARQEQMIVAVKNTDSKTIPDLAITVDPGFTVQSNRTDLSDPSRPVWIVDTAPTAGVTATENTWALGAVKPGQTRRFVWKVTPVQAGARQVHYRIAAGLNGKARARGANGDVPEGTFMVNISPKPSQATVDPATGKVIRDDKPTSGGG